MDISSKALSPPPSYALTDIWEKIVFNQERPETGDFAINKYLVVKENTFNISRNDEKFWEVLADTLTRIYSCVSEHSEHMICNFFPTKTDIILAGKGFAPRSPLLEDMSAKNVFLLWLPLKGFSVIFK